MKPAKKIPFAVLFTKEELETLRARAVVAHMPLGTFIRATLFKLIAAGTILAILCVGCGREALLPDSIDAGTTDDATLLAQTDAGTQSVADLGSQADLTCWDDDSSAFCYPLRHDLGLGPCEQVSPTDCAYAYGTEGCPPNYCRTEPKPIRDAGSGCPDFQSQAQQADMLCR